MRTKRTQMLGVSAFIATGSILFCTWGCTSAPESPVEYPRPAQATQAPAQPAGTTEVAPAGAPIKWTTPEKAPVVQPKESAKTAPAPIADTHQVTTIYVVRVGDTLAGISKNYYGTEANWMLILDANRNVLNSPKDLRPNMRLLIPGAKAGASAFSPGGTPSP